LKALAFTGAEVGQALAPFVKMVGVTRVNVGVGCSLTGIATPKPSYIRRYEQKIPGNINRVWGLEEDRQVD
jgi:hypothetical protein